MAKFFSEEWIKEYANAINESEEYADAAKDWEGDFLFVVDSEEEPLYAYIDIYHGKVRKAYKVDEPSKVKAAFEYRGTLSNWKKLLTGEIDPIKGLLSGKFMLKGDLAKAMRYTKAAQLLVELTKKIETEF